MKKPKHKNFDYTPRFYDPLKDEEERKKRRFKIGFERNRIKPRNSLTKNILILIIVLLILWIVSKAYY
ncbi:MAG: hypothetical protein AB9882_04320 [Ignavibacteriaceae bacterium]